MRSHGIDIAVEDFEDHESQLHFESRARSLLPDKSLSPDYVMNFDVDLGWTWALLGPGPVFSAEVHRGSHSTEVYACVIAV